MKDLSGMLKKWRKEKLKESMQQAQTPLVAPFRPYALPVDDDTDNGDVKTGPKDKKKVAVRYGFTELTDQARKLAVDLKDDSAFAPSTSLPFALERLQAMREKRDAALKAFDVTTIQDAVSQCLYELGPAPQKEGRYQAQKRLSLHRRMETLNLSRHVPKVRFVHDLHLLCPRLCIPETWPWTIKTSIAYHMLRAVHITSNTIIQLHILQAKRITTVLRSPFPSLTQTTYPRLRLFLSNSNPTQHIHTDAGIICTFNSIGLYTRVTLYIQQPSPLYIF